MIRMTWIRFSTFGLIFATVIFAFQNCSSELKASRLGNQSSTGGPTSTADGSLEPIINPNPVLPVPAAVSPIENKAWEKIVTMNAPAGNRRGTVVWTGSKMIYWGGTSKSGSLSETSGSIYDPLTKTWKTISTVNAPISRTFHNAIWDGSQMLVFGGTIEFRDANEPSYAYDPINDKWKNFARISDAQNYGTSVLYKGKVVSIGYSFSKTYDAMADAWIKEPLPLLSSDSQNFLQSPYALLGSKIFIINPYVVGTLEGEIFTYDLATKIKTETRFPRRTIHAYPAHAFTGKEVLMWGTLYGFSDTTNGEIFNPETNAWTPMTEVNSPNAKMQYLKGVWTGKEFLVFDEDDPTTIWSLK